MQRELRLRILSGLFLAIVVLAATWYGGLAFRFVSAAIALLIYYEWSTVTRIADEHGNANIAAWTGQAIMALLADNRELLFRELQHRVSNNLQVAAAMLGLQRRHIDHDAARRALDDASSRLALIGRISRALYDPSGAGNDMRAKNGSASSLTDASPCMSLARIARRVGSARAIKVASSWSDEGIRITETL